MSVAAIFCFNKFFQDTFCNCKLPFIQSIDCCTLHMSLQNFLIPSRSIGRFHNCGEPAILIRSLRLNSSCTPPYSPFIQPFCVAIRTWISDIPSIVTLLQFQFAVNSILEDFTFDFSSSLTFSTLAANFNYNFNSKIFFGAWII